VVADWRAILGDVCAVECEEGERWLSSVVGEEEIRSGGEVAPGTANRTAAKDVLGRKAHKDLVHQNILREGGGGSGDAAAARPRRWC
jgi:hypothetical protein